MTEVLSQKPKLCYIVPRYTENDATHFSHLYDFVEETVKQFDIFLIIERGVRPARNFGCRTVAVVPAILLMRLPILKIYILWARIMGYRDFYIHYSFKAAWIASLMTRIFGGRVFYWNCGEPWKYTRGILREAFERMIYKLVTYIVTGTEGLKKRYAEVYGIPEAKIRVMPNWISLARFTPDGGAVRLKMSLGIPGDARVVLFAHRLSKRKGAQYIPAIAEALKSTNAVVVVAGEGLEKENVKLKVKNLKLEEKIRFVGAVPNHEMPLYYSMADVFIMPSDEEGFPRVILESMAMGVPFVAFDVGGIKEFVPRELQRYIVSHGDIETFANIIGELIAMPTETRRSLQEIGRKAVLQFETKEVVKKFYEMIVIETGE